MLPEPEPEENSEIVASIRKVHRDIVKVNKSMEASIALMKAAKEKSSEKVAEEKSSETSS